MEPLTTALCNICQRSAFLVSIPFLTIDVPIEAAASICLHLLPLLRNPHALPAPSGISATSGLTACRSEEPGPSKGWVERTLRKTSYADLIHVTSQPSASKRHVHMLGEPKSGSVVCPIYGPICTSSRSTAVTTH